MYKTNAIIDISRMYKMPQTNYTCSFKDFVKTVVNGIASSSCSSVKKEKQAAIVAQADLAQLFYIIVAILALLGIIAFICYRCKKKESYTVRPNNHRNWQGRLAQNC